jgi:hypothetical protein
MSEESLPNTAVVQDDVGDKEKWKLQFQLFMMKHIKNNLLQRIVTTKYYEQAIITGLLF